MARKAVKKKERPRGHLKKEGRAIVPGRAPGTLIVDPNSPKPIIRVFAYAPESDEGDLIERTIEAPSAIPSLLKKWPTVWVDVSGMGDLEVVTQIQEVFGIHRLAMEDVLNVNQRPKVETYDGILYMVARLNELSPGLSSEQISIFLGKNFVLTFQERPGDSFDGVRDRLRKGKGRIRIGPDHLAYALIDSIVDHNFPILETYSERLEVMEEEVIERPDKSTIAAVYSIKRDLLTLRRSVWPMRDLMNSLIRDQGDFFIGETNLFLRDCSDHVIQIMDLIESYREISSGLIDVYLSSVSNQMNDVMKVLTLIATIFIPLGFIAGLYGMNFDHETSRWNMPELFLPYGYPMALGLMGVIALSLVVYFRKKGWIGSLRKRDKE